MSDAPNFNRREGWIELIATSGDRWRLEGVPDWVFDYVERGEDIPLRDMPWGRPRRTAPDGPQTVHGKEETAVFRS